MKRVFDWYGIFGAAVVLVDHFKRVQARYENGPVLEDPGRGAPLRAYAPLPPSGTGLDLGR